MAAMRHPDYLVGQSDGPAGWNTHTGPVLGEGASSIFTGLLKGFLLLLIFVSLLALPAQIWLPADQTLEYCLHSIVAMGWLWVFVAPLVAGIVWIVERYLQLLRKDR